MRKKNQNKDLTFLWAKNYEKASFLEPYCSLRKVWDENLLSAVKRQKMSNFLLWQRFLHSILENFFYESFKSARLFLRGSLYYYWQSYSLLYNRIRNAPEKFCFSPVAGKIDPYLGSDQNSNFQKNAFHIASNLSKFRIIIIISEFKGRH